MKFHALCAMVTTLSWCVQAMPSNTRGVRGRHHASLMRTFHKHPDLVPGHDVSRMLKSAESMLVDLASKHSDTPLADLVEQIRPFILQMQDSIRAAHTSAQQTLNNFDNDFSGCTSAKSTGESEATSLENTKIGHSDDHKACRTLQKNVEDQFSSCQSNLQALQGAKDSSCQLFADAERAPGCGAIPANPGETWKSYVARAATWFAGERDSYLHKEEVCNNDTAKLQTETIACLGTDGSGGKKKAAEDKKDDCDAIQNSLESATCSYVSKVEDTCESFSTCANTIADGYEAQLPGIQTLEAQRKVEWNATERLLCMLGAYGADGSADATKLQTCQLIGDNTSHLNLVYPTPTPRPSPCADLLPHPCGSDYISQEYDGLDAPAATCTACSFAVTPITDKTEIKLQNQQGSILAPTWIMKKCHSPQPDTNWKPPAIWTDSASLPTTSDENIYTCDVVALWIVGASVVQDCAAAPCTRQPYPPPSGHWGTPYKPRKDGRPCGEAISPGDAIYFERMDSDQWTGNRFLEDDGNDLYGGTIKTIYTITTASTPAPTSTAPAWSQGALWSEDFESGGSDWRHESTSAYYTGPECYGGSGSCWRFHACTAAGDLFSKLTLPSDCAVSPCTLKYAYKGMVLLGMDSDGVKGGGHFWYPHDQTAIPPSSDWVSRTITGITDANQHLMLETYAGQHCTSYLDNLVITN